MATYTATIRWQLGDESDFLQNSEGKIAITSISLCRKTTFSNQKQPTPAELDSLHHAAHESCFIANSIKSEIHCKPALN